MLSVLWIILCVILYEFYCYSKGYIRKNSQSSTIDKKSSKSKKKKKKKEEKLVGDNK